MVQIGTVVSEKIQFDFLYVHDLGPRSRNEIDLQYSHTFIYLVQKETQCFYLQFLGLKIIDFKNCFNSVVLPSNKDIDCIVSSLIGYRALV